MGNNIKAIWTGKWPSLCYGERHLYIGEREIELPDEIRDSPMNTYGDYKRWHFEDWMEVWETYTDGLLCDDWVRENQSWLSTITTDTELQTEIFYAFQAQDWRHGSCGGCI